MYCQMCGNKLPDGARACPVCGAQIQPMMQPPQQPVQQQAMHQQTQPVQQQPMQPIQQQPIQQQPIQQQAVQPRSQKTSIFANKKTSAVITNMDQPLGRAVGNSLEVIEAIDLLKGKGPSDLMEDCFALGKLMLLSVDAASSEADAENKLQKTIEDGSALEKFADFVEAQGGDRNYIYNTDLFEKAKYKDSVVSPVSGYVSHIETDEIGICSLILGGGRETKESVIDLSVGLTIEKKLGDHVEKGDVLAYIHSNSKEKTFKENGKKRYFS